MDYKADLHVHSVFSEDGHDTLRDMCLAALDKGLKYICFTEHFDLNPADRGYRFFNKERFFRDIDTVRREFGGRIEILKGIEFGEPHLYPEEFAREAQAGYDLVLGSVHWMNGFFAGDPELARQYTKERIFHDYYQEVLAAVKFGGFDVLAHFDFPKRYWGESFPEMAIIDEIIAVMSQNQIALEINTSALRKGLAECTPGLPVIQKYVQAGFGRITIGSDAHRARETGADIERAAELARVAKGIPGIFRERKFVQLNV